ncbi:hypothetical protein DFP72DRAFT_868745 [Ephemerocybe angulata]|uniref:F-box domain-containing protein n=1 Tax=Ephemerocybe angulata TaxID=980116 RepID=A0A8H6MFU2_9AGAR|nr:hypothetical protein DFP72DRAFT_868745 [Tulosesus angulatus]
MPSPTLPPELWETIFRAATLSNGLHELQMHTMHYCHYRADMGHRRTRRALAMKRSIASVCRDWYMLTESLACEHIQLRSYLHLDALIRHMKGSGLLGQPRGNYVRRLDIVAPSGFSKSTPEEERFPKAKAILSQIGELFTLLPNIKIFLFRHAFLGRHNIFDTKEGLYFLTSPSPTLESVTWIDENWNWALLEPPVSLWVKFLESHPNLKTIHRPRLEYEYFDYEEPLLAKPMNQVTQLSLRVDHLGWPDLLLTSDPLSSGREPMDLYPNLRHVVFMFSVVGPMDMEMLDGTLPTPTMLEVHGHKLTSVDCVYHKVLLEDSPQLAWFTMIAQFCPNLEELGVFLNWRWRERESDAEWDIMLPHAFPNVKRLKVRRLVKKFDVAAYRQMLGFVRRAVSGQERTLPSCGRVQFVEERDVLYLRRYRDKLQAELGLLEASGIEILDSQGTPAMLGAK